ncbi:MAG TPA: efflux RND transporter permease subunit, partial [Verrucomicrobiales bacterium]|nr:efflux RND transporter permease subunit [Verrucomicrobiales bacterium]
MNISRFFITRPVFAGVISMIIVIVGAISLWMLPVSEYPEVVPPSIVVSATYPGANPATLAETVASPLEQAINGTENMLYMSSQSTANGVMTLTVTFKLGTDIDKAQMQVQNKVSQALPKLPEEVRRFGVTTVKSSPDLTMVVHLHSPKGRYDALYLRNYANLHVKDELSRLDGIGQVQVFGGGDYAMRVWLNPEKVAARGLTSGDVVRAIQEQNIQVAAGGIGQQPEKASPFELSINAKGRLVTEEEFGNIIVKTGEHGERVKLKEMARLELGSGNYAMRSILNGKQAVGMGIFQLPGSNAIALSNAVRARMAELQKNFPEDVEYAIAYDPTVFVQKSISAVIHTLIEAILLVVVVVVLFLQTWRASIIPLAAVPVSLVGTFAVMHALGFSINNLSLFGLVLAIGIVVDDAIVVVENVERNIEAGLNPKEATRKAMSEVTGPIIATALVLCAVFVPTAFISGLTGQFYKQFAITIAISTVISAFNSLTLSPALSALLLKGHGDKKDLITRLMDRSLGWFFRPFNRFFQWSSEKYVGSVRRILRFAVIALVVYLGLIFTTWKTFESVPAGFIPQQDKQYLVAFTQLPAAASLNRTEAVMEEMSRLALETPGVKDCIGFPGLSIQGFTVAPNEGIVFVGLNSFEDRDTPELQGPAIAAALSAKFSTIKEGITPVFLPPAVMGLGAVGGFKLMITDRENKGYTSLYNATQALVGAARGDTQQVFDPMSILSGYTVNVPQLNAKVDTEKAKMQRVPVSNINEALQINLGSFYVNDFNLLGRTFQVMAQADAQFRDEAADVKRLKTKNAEGKMVPLGSLVDVKESYGPSRVTHYNGYLASDFAAAPAAGFSSGQAEDR